MMAAMENQTEAQTVSAPETAAAAAPAPETPAISPWAATMQDMVKSAVIQHFRSNTHRTFPDILKDFEDANGPDQDLVQDVLCSTPICELLPSGPTAKNGAAKKNGNGKTAPAPRAAAPTADDLTPHQQAAIVKYVNQWESGTEIKTKEVCDETELSSAEVTAFMLELETVEGQRKGRGYIWTVK